jgi:hypothetical protein
MTVIVKHGTETSTIEFTEAEAALIEETATEQGIPVEELLKGLVRSGIRGE